MPRVLVAALALVLPAFAGAAPFVGPTPVQASAVLGAWPVHLDQPWSWTWAVSPVPVVDGTLLVIRTDPSLARPTQYLNPILMVDANALGILRITPDATCVVGLVPSSGMTSARVYWSDADRLPEQIDAEDAARRLAGAATLTAIPLASRATLTATDHRAFDRLLDKLLGQCK